MSQVCPIRAAARVWAAALIAALFVSACTNAAPTSTPVGPPLVLLATSETHAAALSLRRAHIAAWGAGTDIQIRLATAGDAITQLGDDGADLALVFGEPEPHLWAAPIAQIPLRVIVHESNPINEIQAEDLRGLFAGAIADWRTLGGPPAAADIITQDPHLEASRIFTDELLQGGAITGIARVAPGGWAVAQAVGQGPGAIGYLACLEMTTRVRAVAVLQADSGNPIQAMVGLFAVAEEAPKGAALEFLVWAQSPAGRSAVSTGCAE